MAIHSDKGQLHQQFGQLSGGFVQDFAVVETILRNRRQFFEEIRAGLGLQEKIQAMLISSLAFLAVYGAVLGSTHSLLQALSSAVKLPLLFLATMIICIPTLYVFSLLLGANLRLNQVVAVALSTITLVAVLMLSFASITFFFMVTTSGYQFFKLLNVFFFTIAGVMGMISFSQGLRMISASSDDDRKTGRHLVLYLWILLYAFVGSQMAWTLRPFIGYPGANFELVREIGGNFYADVLVSLGELLGFFIVR